MVILLFRHGVTDWNVEHRVQAHEDMPLNEDGIRQAEEHAEQLRGIRAERAVTSPLQRAKKTCEILAAAMGAPEIETEPDFIERDYGPLSGKVITNLFGRYDLPGMEEHDACARRLEKALIRQSEKTEGILLAVSHGAVINAMLYDLTDGEIGTGKTVMRNVACCILTVEKGELSLARWGVEPEEIKAYLKEEGLL